MFNPSAPGTETIEGLLGLAFIEIHLEVTATDLTFQ